MEEAWPSLAPAAGGAAFPPAPPTGTAPPAPVAWGAAATARREAVARESPAQAVSRIVSSCANTSGLAVAVVDANAVISGGAALASTAGRLVTVPEVLEEVRDAAARRRLALLPTPVETVEPAPEFVKKVVKFARETGDLQTLSDVDMKIIALAYMLEAEVHGTSHLREHPPPLHVVSVRTLQEAPLPGWGSNVPNLAEWEALDKMSEAGGDLNSRILPLKDLENQEIPTSETNSVSEAQGDAEFQPSKRDACIPWEDDENNEGWLPAVGRTTHRKYLRRKARRDALKASGQSFDTSSVAPSVDEDNDLSENGLDSVDGPSAVPEETRSNTDNLESLEGNEPKIAGDQLSNGENGVGNADTVEGIIGTDSCTEQLDNLDIKSEAEEGVSASFVDDESSEQSWALRSLSESTVACVTSDYAMQNVILQIGLRLLAPGGMQIRQLHRWVLRCHACYKVTQEIGKIFCPKCGNGGTLRKVSVTVGENGITMASRRPRVTLRGTKFSLPMPQGGRDAVIKNPILREDQLPQKVLHPKSKKSSKLGDDFLGAEDIFTHSGEKKVELKPPVRKALAMFSGKRNPNDNHFSRKKN
ncbi:RNA-binding protein NOB1-like [Triticum dicoccoides]|uniref:RNA-binding protein NOB1-like n=1 Tax=Triticum dicoccoides TaxID=85692 RepID=UPI000E789725|nr:RNA-binding protein NOB1-like [Triticum dicoccoides]